MIIDRRKFVLGSAAGVAAIATPLLPAKGADSSTVAAATGPRDHAGCDPWLVRFVESAPLIVIHELSGAVFRPEESPAEIGAGKFVLDRIWTDYAPPYPLVRLAFEADGGRPMLRQSPPPRSNRSMRRWDLDAIRAAVGGVVERCLDQAKPRNAWIMLRPRISGESLAAEAPRSGFGGPAKLAFPSELRAKLPPKLQSA